MEVTWSYEAERVNSLDLYRDGELVATLSAEQTAYMEDGLSSNTRYTYRATFRLDGGLVKEAEAAAATLAHAPIIVGPWNLTPGSFELAVIDTLNPPETEYRITLFSRDTGMPLTSGPDTSRCRTFEGLRPSAEYYFEAAAINLDGVETRLVIRRDIGEQTAGYFSTQHPTTDHDSRTIARLNAASSLYGLTDRARTWTLSDIRVDVLRNEPGYAGYGGSRVGIGSTGNLATLMHEMMHGYWEH